MGYFKKSLYDIPSEQLTGIEEMFFRQIQMSGEKVVKKFQDLYEETRALAFHSLSGKGIAASFSLQKIEAEKVYLEGGMIIDSPMMARVFAKSEEVVIFAAAIHGYEKLVQSSDDVMSEFFLDGWGTAFIECATSWLKQKIAASLEKQSIYSTCSWSPGQHNVDIHLQDVVFKYLQPEEIGMTLNNSFMMHPKKSVSGFFGIGREKELELIRACDFCHHRDHCPTAYA